MGFRHWASTPPVSRRSRQSATGPPGGYPDRTHTGKRRRADNTRSTTYTVNLLSAGRTAKPHWKFGHPRRSDRFWKFIHDGMWRPPPRPPSLKVAKSMRRSFVTVVGGIDITGPQLTFDYVDLNSGEGCSEGGSPRPTANSCGGG
jgi:hypothetical protein